MSKKRKPSMKGRKNNRHHRRKTGWKSKIIRAVGVAGPSALFRRMRRRVSGSPGFVRVESDVDEDLYGDTDERSDIATPCLIVDKSGTLRWPRLHPPPTEQDGVVAESKVLDSDNFLLKNPSAHTDSKPAVLGWLQVNSDSHIFTPAVQEKGPFRKVP